MTKVDRRQILGGLAAGSIAAASLTTPAVAGRSPEQGNVTVPQGLKPGDRVALVAPSGVTYDKLYLTLAIESLEALGLKPVVGEHVLDRFGYFAGEDKDRAADINSAFADPDISGIFCLRGGWGAARLLDHLDYGLIAGNPKPIIGYSDITALLNAIYTRSGMVTYHGPNGGSPWRDFTVEKLRAALFDGEALNIYRAPEASGTLAKRQFRTQTVVSGMAEGRLIGGNLTVLTALAGSPYFPDMTGHILCLEEIGEYIYRCDRMLTTLATAGVFDRAAGVVFGGFTDCDVEPGGGYGTFSLMDIFGHHLKARGVPSFFGAPFGHIDDKFTLPFGVRARMDADKGTLQLMERPVRVAS